MAKKKKLKKKKSSPKSKKLKKANKKVIAKKKVKKAKKKIIIKKKNKKEKPSPKKIIPKKLKNKKPEPSKESGEEIPAEKIQSPAAETAKEKARLKALNKAREAFKAKEKQKASILAVDQKAFEKQFKLAEPKHKLELEYIIHASLSLLYEFITSPSGLSEWFADDTTITGCVYSFLWEGAKQQARVLAVKENKSIRFQWTDRSPNSYFEFRIEKNELTEELSLIITDFAETADEMNSLEVLWQGQVQRLMKVIGSKI